MHRALLKKSLHETKLLFAGCAIWLFLFSWIRVWIVSRLERGRFQAIIEQLGDVVSTFSPVPLSHFLTFTGRIAYVYEEPLALLVVLAFAISRGSDVVSGEFNRGTLEMLLAQPVSRWQVMTSQACVTILGIACLASVLWIGTYTGIQTTKAKLERQPQIELGFKMSVPVPFTKPVIEKVPMATQVDPVHFIPAAVNLFCLGFCFAGGVSLLSACDRYRWRTVGLAIAFLVLQTVIKVLGVAAKDWRWLRYCSVFNAYEPQKFVEIALNRPDYVWTWSMPGPAETTLFGPLVYDAVLLGLGAAFYLAALVVFTKRDISAPL
jgi:ABC-2 type transport system permease protein